LVIHALVTGGTGGAGGIGWADNLEKRTVFWVKGIKGGLSDFDGFEDRVWLADSLGNQLPLGSFQGFFLRAIQ
jgi:hypothetical protein